MSQKNKNLGFVKGRIKGSLIAIKGAYKFITTEPSGSVQFILAICIILASFYYKISPTEWMIQSLIIALVLSVEAMNTAIEKLCDFVHKEHHEAIGFIKDIAAGGVMFTAVAALIVEILIFYPKIFL